MLTPTGKISKRLDKICPECDRVFNSNQIYCSAKCLSSAKLKLKRKGVCEVCGKEFYHKHRTSGRMFCSRECWKKKVEAIKEENRQVWGDGYAEKANRAG